MESLQLVLKGLGLDWQAIAVLAGGVTILTEFLKNEFPVIQGLYAKLLTLVLAAALSTLQFWSVGVLPVIASTVSVWIAARGGYKLFTRSTVSIQEKRSQ